MTSYGGEVIMGFLQTFLRTVRIAIVLQQLTSPLLQPETFAAGLQKYLASSYAKDFDIRVISKSHSGDTLSLSDFDPDFIVDYSVQDLSLLLDMKAVSPYTFCFVASNQLHLPANASYWKEHSSVWTVIANRINSYFGWTRAILLTDSSEIAVSQTSSVFVKFQVEEGLSSSYYDHLVAREIRVLGVKQIFVLGSEALTNSMLRAFAKYEIDAGYAVIVIGSNCRFDYSIFKTGAICIALQGTEGVAEVDYIYLDFAFQKKPLTDYVVQNLVNGKLKTVGLITNTTMIISSALVYPKGLLMPPNDLPLRIPVNLNNWNDSRYITRQRAAYVALTDISSPFSSFEVVPATLDSCLGYNPVSGYLQCYIDSKTQRVSFLLSRDVSEVLVYQLEFMRITGMKLPVINTLSIVNMLSSVKAYPNFVRLSQTIDYFSSHMVLLFYKLKMLKINLIVSPLFGKAIINQVKTVITNANIEIITPDELLEVKSTPEYYQEFAKVVVNSGIRPVLMITDGVDVLKALEAFGNAGLTAEDIVIFNTYASMTAFRELANESQTHWLEVYRESLFLIIPSAYVNDYGQHIFDEFKEDYEFEAIGAPDCFVFDSMAQAKHAVNFAIRRGLNFYDWQDMIFAVRSVVFQGCTGVVRQSLEHNDRKDIMLSLFQTQLVDEGQEDVKILDISISGSQSYYIYNNPIWYDGSTDTPNLNRLNYDSCPYPDEYLRDSNLSTKRQAAIGFSLAAYAAILACIVYVVYIRRVRFAMSTRPVLLSTQDILIIISVYSELIVLSMLGPAYDFFDSSLDKRLSNAFWFNIDFTHGVYFDVLVACYSGIALISVLIPLICWRKFKPFELDVQVLVVLFLHPFNFYITLALATTYDCNEAYSPTSDYEVTDSVLDFDCFTDCWSGKHMRYAVASVLLSAFYITLSVLFSEAVTNSLDGLQFDVSPTYLLLRLPVIQSLVSLNKARFILPSKVHSALFLIVFGAYTILNIWRKTLSIPSLNMWHHVLALILLEVSLFRTLHVEAYSNVWLWFSIGLITSSLTAIAAKVIWRKLPSSILHPRKIDTMKLFSFAFRFARNGFSREQMYIATNPRDIQSSSQEVLDLSYDIAITSQVHSP